MQETRQIKQIVGENIRARRTALGLTRRALGNRVNAEQNEVYRWERGMHRPADGTLQALSVELEVDLGWLLTDHSDAPVETEKAVA